MNRNANTSYKRYMLFLSAALLAAGTAMADILTAESCPQVTFEVNHYEYQPVTFTAAEDLQIQLPADSWIQTAEVPDSIVPRGCEVTFYVAPDGPSTSPRHTSITLLGTAGTAQAIDIAQQPLAYSGDALPAKWHYALPYEQEQIWFDRGYMPANLNRGTKGAVITAVGVNNRRLGRITTTTFKQCPGVSNLYTGDYLLVSVPVYRVKAGSDVNFMIMMSGNDDTAPRHWITEIRDGDGRWLKPRGGEMRVADDGTEYSYHTRFYKSYEHAMYINTFTLEHDVTDGLLQVRCRVAGDRNGAGETLSPVNTGAVYLPVGEFNMCAVTVGDAGMPVKDSKKIAILGNSYTYYHGEPYLLKEIARSQGHYADIRAFAKGSQYFHHFLERERPLAIVTEPGFDAVILQDQSQQHCRLADGERGTIIEDTKALTARFREGSPSANIILENTWASPKKDWNGYSSAELFTAKLQQGAQEVAAADPNIDSLSPVCEAFYRAYREGVDGLWHTDSQHPGLAGSYLKACVHYLVIYGEPFAGAVADCGLDPAKAATLRRIAQSVALK